MAWGGRKLKNDASRIMLTLLLIGTSMLAFNVQLAKSEPKTWIVDDDGPADFHTIQEAINAANEGDTISVYNGIFYENVVVMNKTISLVGEDRDTTIIDGNVTECCIVVREARNVTITGFTLRNSQAQPATNRAGIWAYASPNINVTGNIIVNNQDGIDLWSSGGSTVIGNMIINNSRYGIWLDYSSSNIFRNNTIAGNRYNFYVYAVSLDNYV